MTYDEAINMRWPINAALNELRTGGIKLVRVVRDEIRDIGAGLKVATIGPDGKVSGKALLDYLKV